MEMRPFLRKNLSDTVKAELYEYIDNLDLDKGTKLPPENTIAQNYGVSRVTVRRALDELEQAALIRRSGKTLEIADEEGMRAMTRSINQ